MDVFIYCLEHVLCVFMRSNHTKKMRRVFFQKKMKSHLSPISIIQLFKKSSNEIYASHRRIDHSKEGCNMLENVKFLSVLRNNALYVTKNIIIFIMHILYILTFINILLEKIQIQTTARSGTGSQTWTWTRT